MHTVRGANQRGCKHSKGDIIPVLLCETLLILFGALCFS
jgi:hypothetical protein